MSPSGAVIARLVKPEPGPDVNVDTMFAPTIRSLALVVVTEALVLVAELPDAAAETSSGLVVSIPEYSRIRMSGNAAAALNFTVTVLVPAPAATMFFA